METTTSNQVKKKLLSKIGTGLLIVGSLCWLIPVIVPFTALTIQSKAIIIPIAIVCAEVMFWAGALLVGKEIIGKYKRYLNPRNWRKKKEHDQGQE